MALSIKGEVIIILVVGADSHPRSVIIKCSRVTLLNLAHLLSINLSTNHYATCIIPLRTKQTLRYVERRLY